MKSLLIICFLFNIFTSYAIIYRHDQDSNEYIKLAQKRDFDFVGNVVKIVKSIDTSDIWSKKPNKGDTVVSHGTCELINEKWVLSAAHLFTNSIKKDTIYYENEKKIETYIITGESQDVSSNYRFIFGGISYEADTILIHPGYISSFIQGMWKDYDVALIKLKESVINTNPVKLYTKNDEIGKRGYCIGYGYYGSAFDKVLKIGKKLAGENIIDTIWNLRDGKAGFLVCDFDSPQKGNECKKNIGSKIPLDRECYIQAGDSGSGFIIEDNDNYFIIGISPSGGTDLAQFEKTGYYCHKFYYLRVSLILDWVDSQIKILSK